jgi:glycosyltransferase involved in cell wall biosynthesis
MLTNPIVTILIPIHGISPFLTETLQSIKKVTYEYLDILLILDRPGINAREIVLEFCHEVENARFLESTVPGISAALNFGIQNSYGEFIARIDADDRIMPSRITAQVNEFKNNQELVLVGTQMRMVDTKGEHIRFTSYPTRNRQIKALLRVRNCIGHPTVMYKRDLVQKIGGYRSEFNGAEDLDLWLRLERHGQFKTINLPLIEYRLSDFQESIKLKANPGALEEKVILNNWEMQYKYLARSVFLSKFLAKVHHDSHTFLIPIWKLGPLKSIHTFWLAEAAFNDSKLKGIYILFKGSLYSPNNFFQLIRYFLRIRINFRSRGWK